MTCNAYAIKNAPNFPSRLDRFVRPSLSESIRRMPNLYDRTEYPSDMTQRQWDAIDPLLPAEAERGRTRENSLREVVNAINYRWTTGCSWRMLPHDYPAWQTVYSYYRFWQSQGLLGEIRRILLSRKLRDRSDNRAPDIPVSSSPDKHPSSSESPTPFRETSSPRLRVSNWPTESVWSPRRS